MLFDLGAYCAPPLCVNICVQPERVVAGVVIVAVVQPSSVQLTMSRSGLDVSVFEEVKPSPFTVTGAPIFTTTAANCPVIARFTKVVAALLSQPFDIAAVATAVPDAPPVVNWN